MGVLGAADEDSISPAYTGAQVDRFRRQRATLHGVLVGIERRQCSKALVEEHLDGGRGDQSGGF
jgi:hypothetical protein